MINVYIIKDYVAIIKDKEIKFTTAANSSRALSRIYKVTGPVLLDQKTLTMLDITLGIEGRYLTEVPEDIRKKAEEYNK